MLMRPTCRDLQVDRVGRLAEDEAHGSRALVCMERFAPELEGDVSGDARNSWRCGVSETTTAMLVSNSYSP